MQLKISSKAIKHLMETPGEARGVPFKTDAEFVLKEKGQAGLKRVEKKLKEFGFPIKYSQIETMAFYPVGLRILSLLAIKEVFNWNDKRIQEMGRAAPKVSLMIKLFMRFFVSIKKTMKEVPKMWQKHFTIGRLLPIKVDEEKKIAILQLEDFNLHPIFCSYIKGYFPKVIEMIVNGPVDCQEVKCFFRGDRYHQLLFRW